MSDLNVDSWHGWSKYKKHEDQRWPYQPVPLAAPHHPPLAIRGLANHVCEVQFHAHLVHSSILVRGEMWILMYVQGTHLFEKLKYEAWISYHVTLAVSEIVSYNHLLHTLHTMHCVNLVSNKPDKLHPWVVFEGTNSDSPTSEPTSHMRQKVVLDWKQAGERENKTWKLHLKNYSTKPVMITWYNRRQPQELKSTPSMQVQDWASKIQPPGSSLCL